MAISSTTRKFLPYVKESSGYVLHRLSADGVIMSNGQTLQTAYNTLNNNSSVNAYADNYIKYTNGLLIQWGSTTHGAHSSAESKITLPVKYIDTAYRVLLTGTRNCHKLKCLSATDSAGNTSKTTNTFYIYSVYDGTPYYEHDIYWVTIGQWK